MRFKEKNLISFEDQWSILESFHLLLAIWMALGIGQSLLFPLFQLQDVKPGLFRLNHFPFHKFEAVPTCCPEGVLFPPQSIDHQGHLHVSCTIASEEFNIVAVQGFLFFISSCHGHCKGNHQHDGQVHGNSIVTGLYRSKLWWGWWGAGGWCKVDGHHVSVFLFSQCVEYDRTWVR